jgi:hypothetical protein
VPVILLQNVSKVYRLTSPLELRRLLQRVLDEAELGRGAAGRDIRYAGVVRADGPAADVIAAYLAGQEPAVAPPISAP